MQQAAGYGVSLPPISIEALIRLSGNVTGRPLLGCKWDWFEWPARFDYLHRVSVVKEFGFNERAGTARAFGRPSVRDHLGVTAFRPHESYKHARHQVIGFVRKAPGIFIGYIPNEVVGFRLYLASLDRKWNKILVFVPPKYVISQLNFSSWSNCFFVGCTIELS